LGAVLIGFPLQGLTAASALRGRSSARTEAATVSKSAILRRQGRAVQRPEPAHRAPPDGAPVCAAHRVLAGRAAGARAAAGPAPRRPTPSTQHRLPAPGSGAQAQT